MASTSTANLFPDLHIGIGMHCHETDMHKPSTQSRLSKIKPHMFRRVMLMNECYRQGESCRREIESEEREAPELSCDMKMMELFPQNQGFADSSIPAKVKANTLCEEDEMLVKDSDEATHLQLPAEQSKCQLTILYNGAMKVFDVSPDKAKIITMMAAGNVRQQTSACDGGSSANWEALPLSGRLMKNSLSAVGSSSAAYHKSDAELPVAKKLSLQRFIQKREDRMRRHLSYPTFAK